MKMLNNTFHTWWYEQQFWEGILLQSANIFQHSKYYHCSHVAIQNIDCYLRACGFEPR